ncbi:hypothetical protein PISMIDRAFT_642324 [Pisolithus microcarpus 441]|uniref:Centrosomin N-terminal motif 1 domain-containing protein n=1 Tax=Pisolithus microcarpus 441 TaxID=765257 RepID=A0A0C9YK28_9AGAM|nr:hypothetical protein PISMIDRAFT_642324 [Pisolithus microcarpus 441]
MDGPETPAARRRTRGNAPGKGVTLTLRDQEKHIDALKKENFNIKLRVHFLEERLAQLAPDQVDAALKQNVSLKVEVQQRGLELKKLKRLVLELERELERTQRERERVTSSNSRGTEREKELEARLAERERDLRELRKGRLSTADADALRQAEARNEELEEELENVRALLEENMEELERLRELVEDRGGGQNDTWSHKVSYLETENEQLHELQRRCEAESLERSSSRAQMLEEREEREAVEEDLNAIRDRLAATMIELQQKEDELEMKNKEIEELVSDHERIVGVVEDEWRGEVEEAKAQVEELRDALAERETESKELRLNISELEANTNDLHAKFEATLQHLEKEAEEKDAELEAANREIEKLGEQVYLLEVENDRLKEEHDRQLEDEAIERERLEALAAALKEQTCTDIHAHRSRQEELAQHVEDLVTELNSERTERERIEQALLKAEKDLDSELRRERRTLESKEAALRDALDELAKTKTMLEQRGQDLKAVQDALTVNEEASKRLGESHTTAKFSLQLEVDRLRRDVQTLEDALTRARQDIAEREGTTRERDATIDKLYNEIRDLTTRLGNQTQARLHLSEKLDSLQASLKTTESELVTYRARAIDLEARLSKDQKQLLNAEAQYRDQLTERNTLLLTIYQYMDKILGVDRTPAKPFTNFSVFHDNLITRLKALSQIQLDFEKHVKGAEARFTERLNEMRKQLDMRWKQIDKFESSVKAYAEAKATWRRKYMTKEGELEALKVTNSELVQQLATSRRPAQSDSQETRTLLSRAVNAEKRLNVVQNQLLQTEEKIVAMNQKTSTTDAKWEARVKEYEARLKAAEEKYKRERQGNKERMMDLENQIKSLERQNELAQKRNAQLENVSEAAKVVGSGARPR